MPVKCGKINRGGLWVHGSDLLFSTLFYARQRTLENDSLSRLGLSQKSQRSSFCPWESYGQDDQKFDF